MKVATENTRPVLTDYMAVGLAEGFEEGSNEDVMLAWSHIARTGLHKSLHGFFGRSINAMVERGLMDWSGNVNWDVYDELTGD